MMDIRRIPKEVKTEDVSQANESSESAAASVNENIASKAGIVEVQDKLKPITHANPFSSLLNPEADQPVIPDSQTSVDPRTDALPGGFKADIQGLDSFGVAGFKLRTSPNHFGVNLSTGGLQETNIVDQILGVVEEQLSGKGITSTTVQQFRRPGMDLIADGDETTTTTDAPAPQQKSTAQKVLDFVVDYLKNLGMTKFSPPLAGEGLSILEGPGMAQDVTGDAKDFVRGIGTFQKLDGGSHYNKAVEDAFKDAVKYVNPDADNSNIQITPEQLERFLNILKSVETMPVNPSDANDTPPVVAQDLQGANPFSHPLVSDRNPEMLEEVALTPEDAVRRLDVITSAKGPDVDPELAPPPPDAPEGGPKPGTGGLS